MNPWYLIGFFIALGPVYWFGSLGYLEMTLVKTFFLLLFSTKVLLFLIARRKKVVFPPIFSFPAALVITILLLASGFKAEHFHNVTSEITKYLVPFFILWMTYNTSFYFQDFEKIVSKILLILPIISVLIVTSFFLGFPSWSSPFYESGLSYVTLDYTGFGSTRTAWSNGMALAYPLLIIGGYEYFRKHKLVLISVIIIMTLSVFYPGGRGGILSILLTTFFAIRFYIPSRSLSTFFSILISITTIFIFALTASDTRALRKISPETDINSLSSGRIESIQTGWDIIKDNPLTGLGVNNINLKNYGHDIESIHNFWVSTGAEYGVLFPLFFTYLFISLILKYFKRKTSLSKEHKASFYVILAGLFMSNLEPGGFIGAFQQQGIFWVCIGRLLYILKYK